MKFPKSEETALLDPNEKESSRDQKLFPLLASGRALRLFWAFLVLMRILAPGSALPASDHIEEQLYREIGGFAQTTLGEARSALPVADRAYLLFLSAVYGHNTRAREEAEALYRGLGQPAGEAFLGSLQILKARDLGEKGILRGWVYSFKRLSSVRTGIDLLDRTRKKYPDDLEVRIVRANTYLELPAPFGKFAEGFSDMKTLLQWLDAGKVEIPNEEPFFRDRAAIYYQAGRYFLKDGQSERATRFFSMSNEASPDSPFGRASRRRLRER